MTSTVANLVGYLGAIVGTSMMLPQIIKIVRTKKADDVSLLMAVLYFLNCVLWLTYGWLIVAWPVIVANATALLISIFQIIVKQKHSRPI